MSEPLEEGFGFVPGRSRAKARALLDAAADLGLDPQKAVRATSAGYVVPIDVLDYYNGEPITAVETIPGTEGGEPTVLKGEPIETPTSDWKNAEIEAWAAAHSVDLGSATKKADMLAAIAAAEKEE